VIDASVTFVTFGPRVDVGARDVHFHTMKSESTRAQSVFYWRRVALAPLCLLLVAGLHAYRVTAANQSPWKGGGFGMFSTVDAPNARFVRAYLITAEGRVPVEVPVRLARHASQVLTAPSQAQLDELAAKFAEQTWVDESRRDERIVQRLQLRDEDAPPLTSLHLRTHRFAQISSDSEPTSIPRRVIAVGSVDQRRQRGDVLAVQRVEMELWRYTYHRADHVLTATPWLTAQAERGASP
jgi:hypothetical protein